MKEKVILYLAFALCVASTLLTMVHPLFCLASVVCALVLLFLGLFYLKSSHTDALTGLSNLHHLNQRKYRKSALCVAYVDLDHLKQINDTQGHKAGDDALKEVADHLQRACSRFETAYRIGGDEFLVVSLSSDAERFSNKLAAIRSSLSHIGISYGIAYGKAPLDPLIRTAEENMYAMKKQNARSLI